MALKQVWFPLSLCVLFPSHNGGKAGAVLIKSVDPLLWFMEAVLIAWHHLGRIPKKMEFDSKQFLSHFLGVTRRWSQAPTNSPSLTTWPRSLCQGTQPCQLYLIFLNHPVLVVLRGWLPGDHDCCPIPIVLSYWNTLRWSAGSCLFRKKNWMVTSVTPTSEFVQVEDDF